MGRTTEIPQGSMKIVKVGGVEVLVANVNEYFYAINNKDPCRRSAGQGDSN